MPTSCTSNNCSSNDVPQRASLPALRRQLQHRKNQKSRYCAFAIDRSRAALSSRLRLHQADNGPDEPESDAWSYSGGPGSFRISHYEASVDHDARCRYVARKGTGAKEHTVGPNCLSECLSVQGYSSWRIGADEMRERTWIQCLHPKKIEWVAELYDENYEIDAEKCFVTGIGKEGVGEFSARGLRPVRHGVKMCHITNKGGPPDAPGAVPMHPSCFQMFKRISIERFGTVDIDGLWNLRKTKGGDRPRFRGFDERADVALVCEQKYHAVVGTEYLASNPTEVPEVVEIIRSCTRAASDIQFSQRPASASTRDPFQALSPELLMMLLEILERQDIANLSMSSQTFSQLPQTFLKQLLRKEMPWVWELDDIGSEENVDWLALYSRLHAADGRNCSDEKARAKGIRSHTLNGKSEIRGLRNRRMIYRDIGIVLDMMAEAKAGQAR